MLTKKEVIAKYAEALAEELEYIASEEESGVQILYNGESYSAEDFAKKVNEQTMEDLANKEECCGKLSFRDELYGYTMRRCADAGVDITYDELDYIVSVMMDFTLD